MRYPGKVIVQILPPLQPGLKGQEFFDTLSEQIETTTNDLVAEARAEGGSFLAPK
jgi:1-acyl-sn-glycerol-3-phosphate acyltransferase